MDMCTQVYLYQKKHQQKFRETPNNSIDSIPRFGSPKPPKLDFSTKALLLWEVRRFRSLCPGFEATAALRRFTLGEENPRRFQWWKISLTWNRITFHGVYGNKIQGSSGKNISTLHMLNVNHCKFFIICLIFHVVTPQFPHTGWLFEIFFGTNNSPLLLEPLGVSRMAIQLQRWRSQGYEFAKHLLLSWTWEMGIVFRMP